MKDAFLGISYLPELLFLTDSPFQKNPWFSYSVFLRDMVFLVSAKVPAVIIPGKRVVRCPLSLEVQHDRVQETPLVVKYRPL